MAEDKNMNQTDEMLDSNENLEEHQEEVKEEKKFINRKRQINLIGMLFIHILAMKTR